MSRDGSSTVVLRFEQPSEQSVGNISKVFGLVRAKNLIDLLGSIELEANPRSSRIGQVTDAIGDSIERSPELFPFMTKGILLGASLYERLERGRYKITFVNPGLEGILDGGHNALEIGMTILFEAGVDRSLLRKVRTWQDFRSLWLDSLREIADLKSRIRSLESPTGDFDGLEFYVPVELLIPTDPADALAVDDFNNSLIAICSARNNNVQLKVEARSNQSGHYDYLKSVVPEHISSEVEWKTNEGGNIKAADVVALTWIPLSVLDQLPRDENERPLEAPVPQNIYRSKGDCVARFERLMSSDLVTVEDSGRRQLHNRQIRSALDVAKDIPELFDIIYESLPKLYNSDGGKFGKIKAVSKMNPENSRAAKLTKFTRRPVQTNVPEGFVVPIVYGLKALIGKREDGTVFWKEDPKEFLRRNLPTIIPQVTLFMNPLGYDPQKFGKAPETYQFAVSAFENALLRSNRPQFVGNSV